MRTPSVSFLVVLALLVAVPTRAASGSAPVEQPTPPPRTPPAATPPALVVESDDGDNRLQIGAMAQVDGRFALDDSQHNVADTFAVRRLRAVTQGRVARHFEFLLNVDLAGGNVNVRDAWVETRVSPAFRVRFGQMKSPTSYDRLLPIASIVFVERGLTAGVAPDRDTGVQILGDLRGGLVSYAAALTNGAVDGGSADLDANEAKDLTGRVVVRPWVAASESPLSGLGLALAASTGRQGFTLPAFQSPGRQKFFSYADAAADGRRTRWSPQGFYYRGPFGGYAEYVHSRGGILKDGVRGDVSHDAWQVAASWVLTGEAASERHIRPRVAFDPPSGHFGALQLAVRVQGFAVSREAMTRGLAAAGASRTAKGLAIGLNWYPNPLVKWNVNVERTTFDAGSSRRPENALLVRTQLAL
jgi:phosphate-selective porin OprO/OprP